MIYLTSALALRLLKSAPKPTLGNLCDALAQPGVTLPGPWAPLRPTQDPNLLESDWSE